MNNTNLENLDILDNIDLSKINIDLENTKYNSSNIDYDTLFDSEIETFDINSLLKTESTTTDITKSENSDIDLKSIVESNIETPNGVVNDKILEKSEIKNNDVDTIVSDKHLEKSEIKNIVEINENIILPKIQNTKKRNSFYLWIIFLVKYLLTSSLIFALLLVTTNYSAYVSIAKSYVFKWDLESKEQKLISSVEASVIKEKYSDEKLKEIESESKIEDSELSIRKMKKIQDKENIDLNIDITPYENRIIIPKIWKNVPLVDIKNRNIDWEKELNNIFMKELEKGVVRYPGSGIPWKIGASFIFWHSSNFPWIKWEYNDVFALLDKVTYNDEIVVYYWQEKFVYKIKEKKVIKPGDVSVLERNQKKSEITLMTCWPIWTTLNRLIVTWELIEK